MMATEGPRRPLMINCFFCQNLCELRKDKNGHHFYTCHHCGYQPHTRYDDSSNLMYEMANDLGKKAMAQISGELCRNCRADVDWDRLPYHKYPITLKSSSTPLDNDETAIIRFRVCPRCGFIVGFMSKK